MMPIITDTMTVVVNPAIAAADCILLSLNTVFQVEMLQFVFVLIFLFAILAFDKTIFILALVLGIMFRVV